MQLPSNRGGLALPNIIFYNRACHARFLWEWLHAHLGPKPCLDSWSALPGSLWSLVVGDRKRVCKDIKNNPIIYNTLRVWWGVRKQINPNGWASFLTPLIKKNQDFIPGLHTNLFNIWHDKGLRVIGDLYEGSTLMTFQQLQSLTFLKNTFMATSRLDTLLAQWIFLPLFQSLTMQSRNSFWTEKVFHISSLLFMLCCTLLTQMM